MTQPFDVVLFASHLNRHRRIPAIACGAAVLIAVAVSLAVPKKYTAMASVLISPPAGNDPRAATALSPIYLESLKTFEKVASSDSLFLSALKDLHLPEATSGRDVESLKREILSVSKPVNTNILEIKTTLRDPRAAQALAQYLAERTVALRRSLDASSEDDVTGAARETLAAAHLRLQRAQAARDAFTASDPIAALEDEAGNAGELLFRLRRDLSDARAELADREARRQQLSAAGSASDGAWIDSEIVAARARIQQLERQDRDLTRVAAEKNKLLEERKSRRELLQTELQAAHAEYETAVGKLNDIRASAMFRGERLQMIDPGVAPRKPSSPNLPLNILVALLLSGVASVVYLAFTFTFAREDAPVYARRHLA